MNHYQPKNMLVTGGAGFIGSNFIRYLLNHEPDVKIVNVDKLTYAGSTKNLEQLPFTDRYHFSQTNITDKDAIAHILSIHEIDTIVHFAAETHVDRSIITPSTFVTSNIVGTFTLLQTAQDYWFKEKHSQPTACRFHYISTDEIHGELSLTEKAFSEESLIKPRSPYSASKAGGEHLVNAYYHTYGLPTTVSRCSNNYGPYQHAEKFIPTIINACLNWQPIPIYGNGKNIRDWLHVEDHCRGILATLKQGKIGECYHFGGNNELQNAELAQLICDTMQLFRPSKQSYRSLIKYIEDRPGHDFRYAMCIEKAKKMLNWQPQIAWPIGIQKTIEFYSKL